MATVYLAQRDGRNVAVKELHDFLAEDPACLAMLADEARILGAIRHPNVVEMLGVIADEEGASALVMEWVDGVSLTALVEALAATGRRLPLDVVVGLARDILAGLDAAHEARGPEGESLEIVHRDVSPQNVLVGFDGLARVIDFGVAKSSVRQQQTIQGAIKGKLGYLAPEQLDGRCDRTTDVFALGVVLWELLTGKRLRTASEIAPVLVEIFCGVVAKPSTHAPEAGPLDGIVLRALRRDPEDRFATAREMAAALTAAVQPGSSARIASVLREVLDDAADLAYAAEARESSTRQRRADRRYSEVVPAAVVAPASGKRPRAA